MWIDECMDRNIYEVMHIDIFYINSVIVGLNNIKY